MADPPPLSRLLAHPLTERLLVRFDREQVAQVCRDILEELRRATAAGRALDPAAVAEETILGKVEARLGGLSEAGLQRVVNATGIVLHAGLGRAPLPRTALQAVTLAATQAVNFEFDLAQGDAGRREDAVADLLVELTGAESATVVNTNAAATLLAVSTIAAGREVVVARRDLARTGGCGIALGELLSKSGATVCPIGEGDAAHAADYASAIGGETALLLNVHDAGSGEPGAADALVRELVRAGQQHGVAVVELLPGGTLVDLRRYGLASLPVVSDRVALGIDLVIFSGDGAVGGPQAGLIAGGTALVQRLTRNPLYHALRCGTLTIAALEGTLRLYREAADIVHEIPALRALTRPLADIDDTARRALPALTSALGVGFRVVVRDSVSRVSSEPGTSGELPTRAIAIEHDYMGAHRIAGRFRQARPPIIGRVEDDFFLLDARTIFDPLELVPNWTDELEEPARYPL